MQGPGLCRNQRRHRRRSPSPSTRPRLPDRDWRDFARGCPTRRSLTDSGIGLAYHPHMGRSSKPGRDRPCDGDDGQQCRLIARYRPPGFAGADPAEVGAAMAVASTMSIARMSGPKFSRGSEAPIRLSMPCSTASLPCRATGGRFPAAVRPGPAIAAGWLSRRNRTLSRRHRLPMRGAASRICAHWSPKWGCEERRCISA